MAEEAIRNPMAGINTLRTPTIVGGVLCIAMLSLSCMKQETPTSGSGTVRIKGI